MNFQERSRAWFIPFDKNSLKLAFTQKFDYILTNPPYGNGTIKAETDSISTIRLEIAFISKIIKSLKIGGKSCIIIPDGILENPSYEPFRKEILEKCDIDAILSLPKFAFAPYTKEKTYAVYITKRSDELTAIQKKSIWMYIIDNDGLANSDKRFPTRLRNNRNGWMHDEISGWVNTEGEEKTGIVEERWLTFDDKDKPSSWITEKGETMKLRKGGFLPIKKITGNKYTVLLPEYYLRPYKPKFIDEEEVDEELKEIKKLIKQIKW